MNEDVDLLRLYLCFNRPDRREADFSDRSWTAFRDWAGPVLDAVRQAGKGTPVAVTRPLPAPYPGLPWPNPASQP